MRSLVDKAHEVGFDLLPCDKDKHPFNVKNFYEDWILDSREEDILDSEYAGIIFKTHGIEKDGRFMVLIDIDTHNETEDALALGESLVAELQNKIAIESGTTVGKMRLVTEKTMHGGYHIFISTDKLVDKKKQKLEYGVEVELYGKGRYCVTSPSTGYETESGLDCIGFEEAFSIFLPYQKLIQILFPFSKEDAKGVERGQEQNVAFNASSKGAKDKMDNAEKNWKEFKAFAYGTSNADWDNITEGSSYDYVRFNIMPWFILTERRDEFLKIIKKYGNKYATQWKAYPDRWLYLDVKDRPIGGDARRRLEEIGYFVKEKKETTQVLHDRFIKEIVPNMYQSCRLIENTPYIYDMEEKHYMAVGFDKTEGEIRNYFLNEEKKTYVPSIVSMLCNSTMKYLEAHANNKKVDWVKPYHIEGDYDYLRETCVVFNNGTLIMTKKGNTFYEDRYFEERVPLYKLNVEFEESLLHVDEDSVIGEWFDIRFPNDKVKEFVQMFFGSMLVPSYNPEIILSIVTPKGGTGKSTLADTLRKVFDPAYDDKIIPSKVLTIPLDKIGDRFIGWDLCYGLVNISTELDGRLKQDAIKEMVSMARMQVERKGVDAFYIKPIAKHISFSNKIPEAVADGGMQRRMAVFPATESKIRPDLNGTMYKKLFLEDYKNLISFMLEGLGKLVNKGFPNMSLLWLEDSEFSFYRASFRENNSSVERFMVNRGYGMVLNTENGIRKSNIYDSYKVWCTENDIKHPVPQKFFYNHVESTGLVKESRKDEDGKRVRVYVASDINGIRDILVKLEDEVM